MKEGLEYRNVMSRFATGVTIVTGVDRSERPVGLTANSVASVSLDPRLILVCLDRGSASLSVFVETGRFGISVLRREDEVLARRFSEETPGERFRDLSLKLTSAGVPVLASSLAWIGCRTWRTVDAGDHVILIGEVVDCSVGREGGPLVFFRGGYGTVAP